MNKSVLTITALVLGISVLLATTSSVLAYKGDPKVQGPNYSPERHATMEKALENKDYEAWKNLMQNRGKVTQIINKSNFARFAEAHKLAKDGKLDEARQIRTELGLGLGLGNKSGSGQYQRMGFNKP